MKIGVHKFMCVTYTNMSTPTDKRSDDNLFVDRTGRKESSIVRARPTFTLIMKSELLYCCDDDWHEANNAAGHALHWRIVYPKLVIGQVRNNDFCWINEWASLRKRYFRIPTLFVWTIARFNDSKIHYWWTLKTPISQSNTSCHQQRIVVPIRESQFR